MDSPRVVPIALFAVFSLSKISDLSVEHELMDNPSINKRWVSFTISYRLFMPFVAKWSVRCANITGLIERDLARKIGKEIVDRYCHSPTISYKRWMNPINHSSFSSVNVRENISQTLETTATTVSRRCETMGE